MSALTHPPEGGGAWCTRPDCGMPVAAHRPEDEHREWARQRRHDARAQLRLQRKGWVYPR